MNKKIVIALVAVVFILAVAFIYLGNDVDPVNEIDPVDENIEDQEGQEQDIDPDQDEDDVDVNQDEEAAEALAEEWIRENSTTFTERGGENLEHGETDRLGDGTLEVIYHFESSFAGYGPVDDDEMAAQVITPHVAVVIVDNGEIVSVVIDNTYDELNQEMVEEDDDEDVPGPYSDINLYFVQVNDGQEEIVAVNREEVLAINGLERSALNALLEGVTTEESEEGYSSAIPEGGSILYFEIDNGVAVVDFTYHIEPAGGSAQVIAVREQIERTLQQFESIEEVEITIEGESEEILQP